MLALLIRKRVGGDVSNELNEHYYSPFWCSIAARRDAEQDPRRYRPAPTWQSDFLCALVESCGSVQRAATAVGVSRQSVYYRRATNPAFAAAMAAILARSRQR
jgi:hypothetical protein